MPKLRNPGPWSFAIFACACLLVGFLYWRGAPDAVKLAGSLIGVMVAAFGAKSALAAKPPPLPIRQKLETWPGVPLVNTPITDHDELAPDTLRRPGSHER